MQSDLQVLEVFRWLKQGGHSFCYDDLFSFLEAKTPNGKDTKRTVLKRHQTEKIAKSFLSFKSDNESARAKPKYNRYDLDSDNDSRKDDSSDDDSSKDDSSDDEGEALPPAPAVVSSVPLAADVPSVPLLMSRTQHEAQLMSSNVAFYQCGGCCGFFHSVCTVCTVCNQEVRNQEVRNKIVTPNGAIISLNDKSGGPDPTSMVVIKCMGGGFHPVTYLKEDKVFGPAEAPVHVDRQWFVIKKQIQKGTWAITRSNGQFVQLRRRKDGIVIMRKVNKTEGGFTMKEL